MSDYITLSNIHGQAKYITCGNIFGALNCAAWLKLKRSFGTGNVSDAGTSGRPKVRVSLRGVRSAKALIGINRDGLQRLVVHDSPKQLDLFPTSAPEIKGQLAAFAVVLRGLIETLIANGSLTKEQAVTLLRETDVKAAFAIWNELQGEMPDSEVKRMEEQATRFLESLWREIGR